MAAWLLSSGVAMCVERCGLATRCYKTHCIVAAWMLNGLCFGEEAGARKLAFFHVMVAAGDERYLVCAAVAAAVVSVANWFLLCVLHEWLCLCAYFYSFLESVVAYRIGMAAWLLSSGVAMRVERCRFATWCCKTHCSGCMNVAWGLCWGGSRSTKPWFLACKVAATGDERYLACAAVAAAVVSVANWFLLCVLHEWLCLCA